MNPRTIFNERFGMLMACASPGSALAYHLGVAASEPLMVQRRAALEGRGEPTEPAATVVTPSRSSTNWLRRAFHRLEQWGWERQMREREAYLAQATDLGDLEARIRHVDGCDVLARARALR